jgi:hypothetical protein
VRRLCLLANACWYVQPANSRVDTFSGLDQSGLRPSLEQRTQLCRSEPWLHWTSFTCVMPIHVGLQSWCCLLSCRGCVNKSRTVRSQRALQFDQHNAAIQEVIYSTLIDALCRSRSSQRHPGDNRYPVEMGVLPYILRETSYAIVHQQNTDAQYSLCTFTPTNEEIWYREEFIKLLMSPWRSEGSTSKNATEWIRR